MSNKRSPGLSGKNRGVTPSVAAPGVTHMTPLDEISDRSRSSRGLRVVMVLSDLVDPRTAGPVCRTFTTRNLVVDRTPGLMCGDARYCSILIKDRWLQRFPRCPIRCPAEIWWPSVKSRPMIAAVLWEYSTTNALCDGHIKQTENVELPTIMTSTFSRRSVDRGCKNLGFLKSKKSKSYFSRFLEKP